MKKSEKKSANKDIIQFFVVIAVIGAAIILSQMQGDNGQVVKATGNDENTILVETKKIGLQKLPIEFSTTGTVRVRNFVETVPQVSGRVVWVNSKFREGGVFKKNETLFRIEPEDFKLMVDQAKAKMKQAETNISLERAESDSAKEEWNILNPNKKAPPLVAREPQIRQAEAELQSAKAVLRDAQLDLNRTGYRLPYSGRVVSSSVEVGQYIQAGQSYGQVYSRDALEVTVPVSDGKLKWLDSEKTKARFKTIYRGEETEIAGKIARISNILDDETRFANVIVTPIADDWSAVIPGIFVDVQFTAQEMDDLWLIPNQALQENNSLWVVGKDKSIKKLSPEIILVNEESAIAKSNGKEIEVIISNLERVNEGMKARIANPEPPKKEKQGKPADE